MVLARQGWSSLHPPHFILYALPKDRRDRDARYVFDPNQGRRSRCNVHWLRGVDREKSYGEVDSGRVCFDLGDIGIRNAAGAPQAGGRDDHYRPRSMWGGYAHGERRLR